MHRAHRFDAAFAVGGQMVGQLFDVHALAPVAGHGFNDQAEGLAHSRPMDETRLRDQYMVAGRASVDHRRWRGHWRHARPDLRGPEDPLQPIMAAAWRARNSAPMKSVVGRCIAAARGRECSSGRGGKKFGQCAAHDGFVEMGPVAPLTAQLAESRKPDQPRLRTAADVVSCAKAPGLLPYRLGRAHAVTEEPCQMPRIRAKLMR